MRNVLVVVGFLAVLGALASGQEPEQESRSGNFPISEVIRRVRQTLKEVERQAREAQANALRFLPKETREKYLAAQTAAKKGQHWDAWHQYKSILESPESKTSFAEFPIGSKSYIRLDALVRRLMAQEYSGLSSRERANLEKEAAGALENLDNATAAGFRDKAWPYLSTEAGLSVLIKAADRLVEAGELAEAIAIYEEVMDLRFHGKKTPESETLLKSLSLIKSLRAKPPEGAAVGIEWIDIPGGTFMLGAESQGDSPHFAQVRSFFMAKTPVTFKQYGACVKAGKCQEVDLDKCQMSRAVLIGSDASDNRFYQPAQFRAAENLPVVCVTWDEAKAFADWAGGRLPSEAEWEYAARGAGQDQKYPWGDEAPTCERAVMQDASGRGCGRWLTWPVCSKPKGNTKQGLCDMAGNVSQWLQDSYDYPYVGAPQDGSAREMPGGIVRSIRGGSWRDGAEDLLSARRSGGIAEDRLYFLGFRLAR